ncbi:MAG: DUF72 domain-containing protein [Candidatus Bathyarchaeia archaeon]|jgi:uncharacterized protein YecE (DUF72 family)
MEYFLGCSGFYYNHWRGRFYPEKLPKTQWLKYYTSKFNTVEINNTFYRFPTEKLLKGWYNKTPLDFKFTVKANRQITHTRKFHNTKDATKRFYQLSKQLKEKLACVLFQLPPFMHKNLDLLQNIADQMDPEVVNVLEFRHESWWSSEVYDLLREKGLVFCCVSASGLPQDLVRTAGVVYVRFHGRNGWYGGDYPDVELEVWAQKIRESNAEKVYCYFNNDVNAYAPKNCLTLKSLLETRK